MLLLTKVEDVMGVFVLRRRIGRFPPISHVNRSATWAPKASRTNNNNNNSQCFQYKFNRGLNVEIIYNTNVKSIIIIFDIVIWGKEFLVNGF